MTSTRRRYLRGLGDAGVGGAVGLAGCTSVGPGDGDAESEGGNGDGLPGSDGNGDAGGTRPAGTGGSGVSVVAVDDVLSIPIEPTVEVVREAATTDHPSRFRVTLTNASDERVRVSEGRAVRFEHVADERGALVLLPGGEEYPAEPGCWRLTEAVATTEEYRTFEVGPGESSERLVDLYATPGEDDCLPVGEHRFETAISIVGTDAEPASSATWGFAVVLECAVGRPPERVAATDIALYITLRNRYHDASERSGMTDDEAVTFGFVCVQNAGRSQMSAAFAERERRERGLDDRVEVVTGGTRPADEVHPEVVEVMREVDVDLADRVPREVSTAELNSCDVVATMGCSTLTLADGVEGRDWALDDPHGQEVERVREIRDEIEGRVADLFDEFFAEE